MAACGFCGKQVLNGQVRTWCRSGQHNHAKCYDRALKSLGIERPNIEGACGWHEGKYYFLAWNEHQTPPILGDKIHNTFGQYYKVVFSKDHVVLLKETKKP